HEETHAPGFDGYCDGRAARSTDPERERRAAQSPDDRVRGGGVHRVPRGDRTTRIPSRPAGLATLWRQRKEVPSDRRPRLDSSRSADESVVTKRLRPERGARGKRGGAAPPSESKRGWGPASSEKGKPYGCSED